MAPASGRRGVRRMAFDALPRHPSACRLRAGRHGDAAAGQGPHAADRRHSGQQRFALLAHPCAVIWPASCMGRVQGRGGIARSTTAAGGYGWHDLVASRGAMRGQPSGGLFCRALVPMAVGGWVRKRCRDCRGKPGMVIAGKIRGTLPSRLGHPGATAGPCDPVSFEPGLPQHWTGTAKRRMVACSGPVPIEWHKSRT